MNRRGFFSAIAAIAGGRFLVPKPIVNLTHIEGSSERWIVNQNLAECILTAKVKADQTRGALTQRQILRDSWAATTDDFKLLDKYGL